MAVDHDGMEYDECADDYVGRTGLLIGDELSITGTVIAARGSVKNNPFAGEIDLLWSPGASLDSGQLGLPRVFTFSLEYVAFERFYEA